MSHNDNNILDRLPRKSGMTVPDGYFEQFSKSMLDMLPEQEFEQPKILSAPQSFWMKVRPYTYLVAMFSGIWLMMWVFNHIAGGNTSYQRMTENPAIANVLGTEQLYQYYDTEVDEYDMLEDLYESGYTPASMVYDSTTQPDTNYN